MKTEHQEQCALIKRCDKIGARMWPHARRRDGTFMILAVPNGGKRTAAGAKQLKNMGVRAGVPDLFVPIPQRKKYGRGHYCGMWIEMKRVDDDSIVSDDQVEWIRRLSDNGYYAIVAMGYNEAWEQLEKYMEGEL